LISPSLLEWGIMEGENPVWLINLRMWYVFKESSCLGLQLKMGGKFLLRLNIGERPIARKYREGKMKSILKRRSNSTWNCWKGNDWSQSYLRVISLLGAIMWYMERFHDRIFVHFWCTCSCGRLTSISNIIKWREECGFSGSVIASGRCDDWDWGLQRIPFGLLVWSLIVSLVPKACLWFQSRWSKG